MCKVWDAADLGMFSMFGQTGPHKKGAPTRGVAIFLQHSNMPEIMG